MKTLPLLLAIFALVAIATISHAGQPDLTPPQSQTLAPYLIVLGDETDGERTARGDEALRRPS